MQRGTKFAPAKQKGAFIVQLILFRFREEAACSAEAGKAEPVVAVYPGLVNQEIVFLELAHENVGDMQNFFCPIFIRQFAEPGFGGRFALNEEFDQGLGQFISAGNQAQALIRGWIGGWAGSRVGTR